ncbi:MAG: copper chaperone PCu(A)C, partial [Pseudomonadota bacterium]
SALSARNGAAFMTITNNGKEADRLVKASADVSATVELHTHLMEDGVMRMRKIEGIDVEPGAAIVLKPGGFHVMLINLKVPLKEGSRFPLTLTFQKGGDMVVEATVAGAGAMGPMGGMGGMKH